MDKTFSMDKTLKRKGNSFVAWNLSIMSLPNMAEGFLEMISLRDSLDSWL